MRTETIKETLDLFYRFPRMMHTALHREIFKPALQSVNTDLSPHHMTILKVLAEEGRLNISEIAEYTTIAKAQMTYSIDRLADLDMIQRRPRTDDRRKIDIVVTSKGKKTVDVFDAAVRDRMAQTLSFLDDEQLLEMMKALKFLIITFEKLKS